MKAAERSEAHNRQQTGCWEVKHSTSSSHIPVTVATKRRRRQYVRGHGPSWPLHIIPAGLLSCSRKQLRSRWNISPIRPFPPHEVDEENRTRGGESECQTSPDQRPTSALLNTITTYHIVYTICPPPPPSLPHQGGSLRRDLLIKLLQTIKLSHTTTSTAHTTSPTSSSSTTTTSYSSSSTPSTRSRGDSEIIVIVLLLLLLRHCVH
eukprot:scaffold1812_cov178-Ochromonas_danica.AAC.1